MPVGGDVRSAVLWASQNEILSHIQPEHAPDTLSAFMLKACRADPNWFTKEMLKPLLAQKDKESAEAIRFQDDGRKQFAVIDAIEKRLKDARATSDTVQASGVESDEPFATDPSGHNA